MKIYGRWGKEKWEYFNKDIPKYIDINKKQNYNFKIFNLHRKVKKLKTNVSELPNPNIHSM
jgi:hypothetical protein